MLGAGYRMKKEKYDGFFGGLYKRNETFLMLSTAIILLVSILLGFALAGILSPILDSVLSDFKRQIVEGQIKLTTLSIFTNNLKVALFIYVEGYYLELLLLFTSFINGIFIGYAGTQFPLGDYIIFTIPHGIPEIIRNYNSRCCRIQTG